jgi:deazaflavin-dependent oxidoreductase (nitroreductase family)
LLTGLPVITLTTTGAKSGKKRSVPLIGIPDGDNYIVIASNWGQKHFPAWYHNLTANPRVAITRDHQSGRYIARETTGEEYDTYWKTAVEMYAGYAAYKRRTGGRRIPIVMLTPDGR